MKIETKYNIGDRFWYLFELNGSVHVYQDVITEITINSSGKVLYYGQKLSDEIPEDYIIPYADTEILVEQIKNLSA